MEEVATLYAHGRDLDEQATWAHLGVGDVLVAEHVRATGRVEHGCFHGRNLPPSTVPG